MSDVDENRYRRPNTRIQGYRANMGCAQISSVAVTPLTEGINLTLPHFSTFFRAIWITSSTSNVHKNVLNDYESREIRA